MSARSDLYFAPGADLRGERNPHARLTADQAAEIRARRLAGERLKTLAAEFGVDISMVHLIAVGKRWA